MKNKGFTLMEILAVIVVLALVSAIVIPSIDRYIKGSADSAYEVQIKLMVSAVKNWEVDYPENLPRINGQSYIVSLEELKNGGYIKRELINPKTKQRFSNDTFITITLENNRHVYKVTVN